MKYNNYHVIARNEAIQENSYKLQDWIASQARNDGKRENRRNEIIVIN